ncbi:sulfite exporter TauE/SafE family protein [Ramlibacter sp. PS4R-6]|uniref:sulfite exporter TauE/SafE family protein n=1 Tax=Ramlibacter sp. PS4R-6 TaxID=3133438 RepID=UPI0030ACA5BF
MDYLLVLSLGLVAGTLGGIVGFGTSIMLMPALVLVYGPKQAVPIMAIGSILANASRVAAWWREVDWRTTLAYSVTAMPAAAAGARTLLVLPTGIVEGVLGAFFIAMIPIRRWMLRQQWQLTRVHMALVGAFIGFATGMVVSTGPINTPFFLMHGLVKGSYLATEAMSSIGVYVAKAIAFRSFGALPLEVFVQGLIVGSTLLAGAFIGKHFVRRLDAERFRYLMDGVMLVAGLVMLAAAFTA